MAAACLMPLDVNIRGVRDSKVLTAAEREEVFRELTGHPRVAFSTCVRCQPWNFQLSKLRKHSHLLSSAPAAEREEESRALQVCGQRNQRKKPKRCFQLPIPADDAFRTQVSVIHEVGCATVNMVGNCMSTLVSTLQVKTSMSCCRYIVEAFVIDEVGCGAANMVAMAGAWRNLAAADPDFALVDGVLLPRVRF